jgi:DNA primase small subunit
MPADRSVQFAVAMFSKHYRQVALAMPGRFSKREFGFMFFDGHGMKRHLGFPNRAQLKNYLVENAPAHAYYSSAYYEKPAAPTMQEKKWLGADLIFDLDADHVKGAENLPYEKMLERVKDEVRRLIDEFILGDLGFDAEEIKIVFSGGRGYHVHISDPSVIRLSSHERREIVDYVTGTDLDIEWIFPKTPIEISKYGDRVNIVYKRRMVKTSDGGWLARIRRGIDSLFVEMEGLEPEERKRRLSKMMEDAGNRMGKKTLDGLYSELYRVDVGVRGIDRMRNEDNFEIFSDDRHLSAFLNFIKRGMALDIAGETDEPVTSDIKRLIRLPSSLHGKTGFQVVQLSREELDGFDPFRDAVSSAFGSEKVNVTLENPLEFCLRDQSFCLDAGKNTVPEFAAVYLVCRRLASVESR